MKKLVWLMVILGLGMGFWAWKNKDSGKIEIVYDSQTEIQKRKDAILVGKIKEVTKNQAGEYAVKVMRLTNGETYGFNENATMAARSVIKVPIILTVIRLGLGDEYDDLLLRMGKNSDNNAQAKIVQAVGLPEIQKTLDQIGMTKTDYEQNFTTADDAAKLWKYIYDRPDKDTFTKYLTNSIFEDRIAKGIPDGVVLVHKVGTDVDVWNDSGIVMSPKPFILVILNEGVVREEAEKVVPQIVNMIWSYETSL